MASVDAALPAAPHGAASAGGAAYGPGVGATAGFLLAAAAALALAVRFPVGTTVLGLAVFGILHNVLELRYVTGRYADVLRGRLLRVLLVLCTGIVLCRLVPGAATRTAEIVLAYGLLAVAAGYAFRHRPLWLAGAGTVLAAAAATSLAWPAYHFVVLTHLHNLVPLAFLWEWSRTLPERALPGRAAFRAVQCGWVLAVPALLLAGAFDGWLAAGGAWAQRLAVAYTPPVWADPVTSLRFLAVFGFLQTMHYVVWVWFLPRYASDATEAFERRVPALRGWRIWALGAAAAALLGVLFAADYGQGRSLYAAVATYHAYLEFPVLLILLLGLRPGAAPGPPRPDGRC